MKKESVSLTKEEEQRYKRAGLGQEMGFGERPAVLVIDFIYVFTDPDMPLGSDMDEEVGYTAQVLHLARQKRCR